MLPEEKKKLESLVLSLEGEIETVMRALGMAKYCVSAIDEMVKDADQYKRLPDPLL